MQVSLENKIALVTGAGRGLGKEIALFLAQAGAYVICVSKSSTCQTVADELNASGLKAEAHSVDVSNSAAVQTLCEQLLKTHQCIDILVNNAGITRDNLLMRMSEEEWDAVIQTNLSSMFYFSKHLMRPMTKKRAGRIINVSSVVGLMGNAGQFNYCAAKAGMLGATKSLARELAPRNVTVNAIAPGFMKTDMTAALSDDIQEQIAKTIPLKRMGTAADIASIVTFVASDLSAYITGQTFSVDGGMQMS